MLVFYSKMAQFHTIRKCSNTTPPGMTIKHDLDTVELLARRLQQNMASIAVP